MGAKGFQDVDLGEIQELIDCTPEEFTEDDLVELSVSEPVPDDEEEDRSSSQKTVDIRQSGRRFLIIQDCFWPLLYGSFYDTGTETKAYGGRRIGTIWKHF